MQKLLKVRAALLIPLPIISITTGFSQTSDLGTNFKVDLRYGLLILECTQSKESLILQLKGNTIRFFKKQKEKLFKTKKNSKSRDLFKVFELFEKEY